MTHREQDSIFHELENLADGARLTRLDALMDETPHQRMISMDNEIAALVGYQFCDELAERYCTLLTAQVEPLMELVEYVLNALSIALGTRPCHRCKKLFRSTHHTDAFCSSWHVMTYNK